MVTLSVILISFTAIPDSSEPVFSSLIFWGLLLSLVADVLLMIVEVRMLLHGLVFFLLAHVLYISAFATRYEFSATHLALVPVIAAPMALFFMKIRGKAGKMAAPVLVYMSVISTMVFLAVAGAFDGSAGLRGYIGAARLYSLCRTRLSLSRILPETCSRYGSGRYTLRRDAARTVLQITGIKVYG